MAPATATKTIFLFNISSSPHSQHNLTNGFRLRTQDGVTIVKVREECVMLFGVKDKESLRR
jgi:hypothetical protein